MCIRMYVYIYISSWLYPNGIPIKPGNHENMILIIYPHFGVLVICSTVLMPCNHGHPWLRNFQIETIPLYPRCPPSPLGLHTIPVVVPLSQLNSPGAWQNPGLLFSHKFVGYTPQQNPSVSNVDQVTEQTVCCRPICVYLYAYVCIYIYVHMKISYNIYNELTWF